MSSEWRSGRHPRWRIQGTLTTTSPLHIGSGDLTTYDHPHLKDKDGVCNDIQAVVKDYAGKPCIPGSAIKGVLRSWAEQMFLLHQTNSVASNPRFDGPCNRIFGSRRVDDKDVEAGWAEFCTAMVQTPQELNAFETHVPYWKAESLTGILSHVGMDRDLGAAHHNKLFYEEFVPEGVAFKVEINATRLTDNEISLLLAILDQGSSHSTHPWQFGANGGNGWGRMQWNLESVYHHDAAGGHLAANQVSFDCCRTPSEVVPIDLTPDLQVPAHVSLHVILACNGPFLVNDASRTQHEKRDEAEPPQHNSFTPLHRQDGSVWLPASSFRGVLRERAEFLLRSLDPAATGDPNKALGDGPIERIFGQTSQSTKLIIEEFTEADRCKEKRQDFVAIDRFTGGAAEGAKFDALYADRPTFESNLTLNLRGLEPEDIALLRLALRDICEGLSPIGWGGAKGYGEMSGILSDERSVGLPEAWNTSDSIWSDTLDDHDKRWLTEHLEALCSTEASTPSATDEPESSSKTPGHSTQEGVLVVTQSKQGRIIYTLQFTRPNGRPGSVTVREEHVRADLRQVTQGTEVDYDHEDSNRVGIRPRGEARVTTVEPGAELGRRAGRFAHPYYFLRMEDREKFSGPLKDSKPIGHSRLRPGLFSGKIRVRLTTQTELLICDDESVKECTETGHKTYSLRLNTYGKPDLASTSVRGMLRSAFEAVTNSRFGVFPARPNAEEPQKPAKVDTEALLKRANAKRLGYRMRAEDGLSLVPVRVENGEAFLMLGTTSALPSFNRRWRVPGALYAAWVPQYRKDVSGYAKNAVTIHGAPPQHGQTAWCWLEKIQHESRPMTFWRVRQAASSESALSADPPAMSTASSNYVSGEEFIKTDGVFVISNQNIKNKHDERFFFEEKPTPAIMDKGAWEKYQLLLQDCRDVHATDLKDRNDHGVPPERYTASNPRDGKAEVAAMSRHTYDSAALPTDSGVTYGYGYVERQGGQYQIKALYPVMISRKLFDASPLDLLPDSLRPATDIQRLSPADRVFGWVSQDKEAQGDAESAYRSHLRLSPVSCLTEPDKAIDQSVRTLAILGQPKPQQGRFYLGDEGGNAQAKDRSKEAAGYGIGNRIRGAKVYPHHHNGVVDQYAHSNEPTNQNRTVQGCVRPGTEFEFDLHLTNLSRFELGGLLWVLSLPDDHYLKLGLGKPLGYGSVRAEIDADQTVITDSAQWLKSRLDWEFRPESIDTVEVISDFKDVIEASNPKLLISFLRAASGFGETPVHYPLLSGNEEHFQWFVKNDTEGNQYPLPDLSESDITLSRQLS